MMFSLAALFMTLVSLVQGVVASPVAYEERDVGRVERPLQRTIVVVVCISYAFILAFVQGKLENKSSSLLIRFR